MSASATITGLVPYAVIREAQKAGLDPSAFFQAAGLAPDKPPPINAHLDIELYYELWERIMAVCKDPGFPVVAGSSFRIDDSEAFGFLAMRCESLGEAFARTARYRVLYNQGARWELQQEPNSTRLIWYPWPGNRERAGVRAAVELGLVDMCSAARQLSGTELLPLAVLLLTPSLEIVARCGHSSGFSHSSARSWTNSSCRLISSPRGSPRSIRVCETISRRSAEKNVVRPARMNQDV